MKGVLKFLLMPTSSNPKPALAQRNLSEAEIELIGLCVRVSRFIGLPKSVGEIYGLLFVSPEPLCLEQCIEMLQISQGSASQGINQLRQLKAIKAVYLPGDRRDFYLPETGLGRIAAGFFSTRVVPGLQDIHEQLEVIDNQFGLDSDESSAFLKNRVAKLRQWHKEASEILPVVNSILKTG